MRDENDNDLQGYVIRYIGAHSRQGLRHLKKSRITKKIDVQIRETFRLKSSRLLISDEKNSSGNGDK